MTLQLYTSWFSTFARKVAIGLELKGLEYSWIDGLERNRRSELLKVNPRGEVPVLIDDGLMIVNSSDILQYLDWRYPERPLFPADISERVCARALERLADERLDPTIVDSALWGWAERDDTPPAGLKEAGQADLNAVLDELEAELRIRDKPWPFGEPGAVECAWFPNLAAARPLGFEVSQDSFPLVCQWLAAMREHPVFANDRRRTAEFLQNLSGANHERRRIFWSGNRIEWFFSRGFGDWFHDEVVHGRTAFPYANEGAVEQADA